MKQNSSSLCDIILAVVIGVTAFLAISVTDWVLNVWLIVKTAKWMGWL